MVDIILFWDIVCWNKFLLDGIRVSKLIDILFVDFLKMVIEFGFLLKEVMLLWI